MEANELRIGNIVNYSPIDKIYTCDIDAFDIQKIDEDEKYAKLHSPIPLNEEWLFKLSNGLDIKINGKGTVVIDRFCLIWRSEYKFWYVMDDAVGTYITKVEFVHEWQNVYFTLNGVELTKIN